MLQTPTTTTTLLLASLLDESNEAVWRAFDERYRPLIHAFARRLGLSDDDAADVAQESLLRFVRSYRAGQYDRGRGRLRSWILGIVSCRVADLRSSASSRREVQGPSDCNGLPSLERMTEVWDEEHRREILRQALAELRRSTKTSDSTLTAFELFVLHEQPAAAVAARLGLTPHDVYMAKRRVTERLRDIVARLEGLYADGA